jgi:cytochrome c551/c552
MNKYIVVSLLFALLLSLSGCGADEAAAELPMPTPIPTFTPFVAQAQPTPVAATPAAEAEVTPDVPEVEETPITVEEVAPPEVAATPEAEVTPDVAVTEPAEPDPAEAAVTPEAPTPAPAEVRRPTITLQPLAPRTAPEAEAVADEVETPTPAVTPAVTPEVTPEAVEDRATPEAEAPALNEQPVAADLPADFAATLADADPAHGEQLFNTTGCAACHSLAEGMRLVGPALYNIGDIAEERVEGQSAELYLYHSIIHPNEYVVEGFPPGIMPNNYENLLSTQDIADMMAFLLTLRGN